MPVELADPALNAELVALDARAALRSEHVGEDVEALLDLFDRYGERLSASALARLSLRLADECMVRGRMDLGEEATEQALQRGDAHVAPALQVRLLCTRARQHMRGQRMALVAPLLQRATELLRLHPDRGAEAMLLASQAQLSRRNGDAAQAVRQAQRALELVADAGAEVERAAFIAGVYATLAIAYRELSDQAARLETLLRGCAVNAACGRVYDAANLMTGLFDMALEQGDLEQARETLDRAQAMTRAAAARVIHSYEFQLRLCHTRWLAASGQMAKACELLESQCEERATAAAPESRAVWFQQLADWRAQLGQGRLALQAQREVQRLRSWELQFGTKVLLEQQQESMGREFSQAAAARAALRSAELEQRNEELQLALRRQRELEEAFIERSRLAGLGSLLAGVAHELNTPLGTALTTLSTARERQQALAAQLQSRTGSSRQQLLQALTLADQARAIARRNLERAQLLLASYRGLQSDAPESAEGLDAEAVHRIALQAWARSGAANARLELQLHLAPELRLALPEQALDELLQQLFQNVLRHAYEPGAAGWVRIETMRSAGSQTWQLELCDGGRGIAPELLPHVFEPYVSTQFGTGRSGLGLFVAAATARRLGARLQARNRDEGGACFSLRGVLQGPGGP